MIKPLDMMSYSKEEAIATLQREFGWQAYANKHFEYIFTRFIGYINFYLSKLNIKSLA